MIELALILALVGFSPVDVSPEGFECLHRNVYFEAGNQSFEGKLAVASVTVNRKRSERFPKHVCAVVNQKREVGSGVVCQFSWVCQGKTVRLDNPIEKRAWFRSWIAAKVVVTFGPMKSLGRSMYFHARTASPGWRAKMARVATIGDHVFYEG